MGLFFFVFVYSIFFGHKWKKKTINRLNQYLSYSIRDPSNNISELDKCIESMLNNKIFSPQRPSLGLMYHSPTISRDILQSLQLIRLLFYPRVMQRKHEWSIIYLSPIYHIRFV